MDANVVDAAGSHAKRVWVPVEARRQWPSGMPAVGVEWTGSGSDGRASRCRRLARSRDRVSAIAYEETSVSDHSCELAPV